MLSNELKVFQTGELARHPWQDNVPDISGKEWADFLADVLRRGIVEPIRVSTRLGYPVIVDGHQRHRAATELKLSEIQAFAQPFETEAQEVEYLAAAAQMRRHLSDFQRVTLARAYEEYFKPMAAERQKAGKALESNDARVAAEETNIGSNDPRLIGRENNLPSNEGRLDPAQDLAEGQTLQSNDGKVAPRQERTSSAQAAKAAGLSEATYRRGKAVQDKAPEAVKEAYAAEKLSTNAAYSLTRAPDPIQEALERNEIDVDQAVRVDRNRQLRKDVAEGRKTVQEAVSVADMMQQAKERREAEMGEKEAYAMQDALQKIMDIDLEDYLFVLRSRHNKEVWGNSFASDWAEAIRHMQALANAAEGRTVEGEFKVIEALN